MCRSIITSTNRDYPTVPVRLLSQYIYIYIYICIYIYIYIHIYIYIYIYIYIGFLIPTAPPR